MNPETYSSNPLFNTSDPYERYAYGLVLDLLLDADEYDPAVPGRVQDQEERNKHLLGRRRAELITAQAVIDEVLVRNFRAGLDELPY